MERFVKPYKYNFPACLFTVILLAFFSIFSQAQIVHHQTLETLKKDRFLPANSVSQDAGMVQFEDIGEKLYLFDFNSFSIKFYNEDSTLYRNINIEFNLDQMFFWDIPLENIEILGLSQYLFDKDKGIEFLVYITYTPKSFSHSFSRRARYYVVDDDGSLLLRVGGSKVTKFPKLVNTHSGAKMFLPVTNFKTEVYSLPGKVPGLYQRIEVEETPIPEILKVGDRISLHQIRFNQSSYKLREDAYPEIEILLNMLTDNPKMIILLEGHTDNHGKAEVNMKLSEDRVAVIKKFLIDKGIKSRRIKIKGFGETKPIASNETEETRKLNRRVEMVVLKN